MIFWDVSFFEKKTWVRKGRENAYSVSPLSSFCRHGTGMRELGFVILTCSFLSSVELAGKNVNVLIVLERSMRKHKAFGSCAQKIIYKVTTDICSRIFTKNVPG